MAQDNPILKQTQGQGQGQTNAPSSLDVLQGQLKANAEYAKTATAQLEAGRVTTGEQTDVLIEAVDASSAANQIIKSAELAAELKLQNTTNKMLEAAGGTKEQERLMTTLAEDGKKVEGLLNKREAILNDEPTGFMIIDQIINGFKAVTTRVALKEAEAQYQQTATQITTIASAQESVNRTNTIAKQTLNEAAIEASYKALTAQGAIQGAQAKLEGVRNNSQAYQAVLSANGQQAASYQAIYTAEGQAEERILSRERQKFQREQMAQQREMWEFDKPRAAAQLKALELELKTNTALQPSKVVALQAQYEDTARLIKSHDMARAEQVAYIQATQAAGNLKPETAEMIEYKIGNASTRDNYIKMAEMGNQGKPSFGLDPSEGLEGYNTVNPNRAGEVPSQVQLLDEIEDKMASTFLLEGKNLPKDPAAVAAAFNNLAAVLMKEKAAEVKFGDNTNPYQAPPMATLAQFARVKNDHFYKKVLAAKNYTEVNPQLILQDAKAALNSGTISPEGIAKGVTTLFQTAAAHNNTMGGGFSRYGLGEFNQKSYIIKAQRLPTAFEIAKGVAFGLSSQIGIIDTPRRLLDPASMDAELARVLQKNTTKYVSVDLMDEVSFKNFLLTFSKD